MLNWKPLNLWRFSQLLSYVCKHSRLCTLPPQAVSLHHGSQLQYTRPVFITPPGRKVMICGSELRYSRSLSLCFCMNMGPTPQLVRGQPLLHGDGQLCRLQRQLWTNSVLGLFIKVYCSGKDYRSEEHSVLASSWVCSSPLPICFFLNKGKYYPFSLFISGKETSFLTCLTVTGRLFAKCQLCPHSSAVYSRHLWQ